MEISVRCGDCCADCCIVAQMSRGLSLKTLRHLVSRGLITDECLSWGIETTILFGLDFRHHAQTSSLTGALSGVMCGNIGGFTYKACGPIVRDASMDDVALDHVMIHEIALRLAWYPQRQRPRDRKFDLMVQRLLNDYDLIKDFTLRLP